MLELKLLASEPSRGALNNPLLNPTDTPKVFHAMTRLFVLIVHNTRLESLVSKNKQLERPNMKGPTVEAMVLNHSDMVRLAPTM